MSCGIRRLFSCPSLAWKKTSTLRAGLREIAPMIFRTPHTGNLASVRFFSVARRRGRSGEKAAKPELAKMGDGLDGAFYVVRKGDAIGVYASFTDYQDQVCNPSSVCDDSVSVYKGYSLQKETEEYLSSRGLKNALYSINAKDCREDLFRTLAPCPFQEPNINMFSCEKLSEMPSSEMGLNKVGEISEAQGLSGSALDSTDLPKKTRKRTKSSASKAAVSKDALLGSAFDSTDLPNKTRKQAKSSTSKTAISKDGCSGSALDSTVLPKKIRKQAKSSASQAAFSKDEPNNNMTSSEKLSETPSFGMESKEMGESSEALGLSGSSLDSTDLPKKTRKEAKSSASQQPVSKDLSCIVEFDGASKGNPGQAGAGAILRTEDGRIVQDRWKTKHHRLSGLCTEAKQLKKEFNICQVERKVNSDADAQANLAINLPCGEVYDL